MAKILWEKALTEKDHEISTKNGGFYYKVLFAVNTVGTTFLTEYQVWAFTIEDKKDMLLLCIYL